MRVLKTLKKTNVLKKKNESNCDQFKYTRYL